MEPTVPIEAATHALRRVRPSVYRLGRDAGRTTITLTVAASAAGRRNAATRVITALAAGGLDAIADDPIAALTHGASLVLAPQTDSENSR